jgi:hypothetical protein
VRHAIAVFVVLALGTGCSTHTSVADKCMTDARQFISEVNEHRSTYNDSGMFATALGQRATGEMFNRDDEMIGCIANDAAHRVYYREALDKNESVEVDRFMRYLLDTQQMRDFGEWEREKQAGAVR